jgi:hypothetical protein
MDRLSPQARAAEIEIDSAYKSNPLLRLNFAAAAWHVLAVIEESLFLPVFQGEGLTAQRHSALADRYIHTLRHPFNWLRSSCPLGGRLPTRYDESACRAAIDLVVLGRQYDRFYLAFTYASRGIMDLSVDGHVLVPDHDFLKDTQYEAYSRLAKPVERNTSEEAELYEALYVNIGHALQVSGNNFSVVVDPALVQLAKDFLRSRLDKRFLLPGGWRFSRYSISDFRGVYETVLSLACIQHVAHLIAAASGCGGNGFINCLLVLTKDRLLNRVTRYTGMPSQTVAEVLNDLTLGSHNIPAERGDPALQPVIPLDEKLCAVPPFLWLNGAAERNFIVLMNKLPEERAIYSRLVQQKEDLMRERIVARVGSKKWRTWTGKIAGRPDLPDVDLALIDDSRKVCLLTELKWFLDPAEAKEIVEKSEEIAKGISQLLLLKEAVREGYSPLFERLAIDPTYDVRLALVSANWIGHASVQHPKVPVINEEHLLERLKTRGSLSEVVTWLSERRYLPVEGEHYEIITTTAKVGEWEMNWYGISPLIPDNILKV